MSWSSGTNTIKEGDESKSLTLQMLELKKQGGGTEYFVRKNDVKLGTKSVTQNGTYTAAADNKTGFSQFSVNVRGGNGSADSQGKPNTSSDIKPGGAGSAVVGTDPETGNDYAVGVDENGSLVQTPVPSGIKIVTPPTKTNYVYQEDMDYTGIVASAIKKDGTTFTDARYTTGHIPMQELIFPVDKAPAGSGSIHFAGVPVVTKMETNQALSRGVAMFSVQSGPHAGSYLLAGSTPNIDISWFWYGNYRVEVATGNNGTIFYGYTADLGTENLSTGLYTPYNQLFYHIWDMGEFEEWTKIGGNTFESLEAGLAYMAAHTSGTNTATIPVKWNNPYTGDTHQDTFEITSTPADGDAHTSTGSSGTEGSGGGGTF